MNTINKISAEINRMAKVDQDLRKKARGVTDPNNAAWKEIEIVDKTNLRRIKEIVDQLGLISISKFGKKAPFSTWLLIQHAPKSELKFMKKYLSLMESEINGVDKKNFAYLKDRILVYEEKPQVYGTQLKWNQENNKWELYSLDNPKTVDRLRKEMDLEPLNDYLMKYKRLSQGS